MAHRTLAPFTYTPAKLGLDEVTLAAERTSNSFDVRYRSEVFVEIKATRDAYTNITVTFQTSPDNGTTWFDVQSESIAAGTGTLSDYTATKTTSSSDNFSTSLTDVNGKDMRLKIDGASGGASDTASVWVTVK